MAAVIILASTVTAPGFLRWALSTPTAVLVLILARRRIISSFPMGARNPPTPMDRGSGVFPQAPEYSRARCRAPARSGPGVGLSWRVLLPVMAMSTSLRGHFRYMSWYRA